jgi:flavin reductase (DIM6/NTAB) family NADH-FMN oxidoreductase RutF
MSDLQVRFREVMASVCAPVSVVTAMNGKLPHGTTVSAFASLSVQPPMVLVALDSGSQLPALVGHGSRFGLNVLTSAQAGLALAFASKSGQANRLRLTGSLGCRRRDRHPPIHLKGPE